MRLPHIRRSFRKAFEFYHEFSRASTSNLPSNYVVHISHNWKIKVLISIYLSLDKSVRLGIENRIDCNIQRSNGLKKVNLNFCLGRCPSKYCIDDVFDMANLEWIIYERQISEEVDD